MSGRSGRGGFALRLYAAALLSYPREHRREHAGELIAMFEEGYLAARERGAAAAATKLARALLDVAVHGVAERRSARRHRRAGAGNGKAALEEITRDLAFGVRTLMASPTFTIVVVTTLAIGIGGSTAIFGVVDAILLRPLPFDEPDRLMAVWETSGDWLRNSVAAANFLDWRSGADSFERLAAYGQHSVTLTGVDEPLRLSGFRVSAGFFQILGAEAARGRVFVDREDDRAADPVVVLSNGLWQRIFGGDRGVVGRTISLDDRPHVVVGIMPQGFSFPREGTDFWLPMAFSPEESESRSWRYLSVIGKLAEGRTFADAQAQMQALAANLAETYPRANSEVSANVIPLREELIGRVRSTLSVVFGAIIFVLILACANVANLMLARATSRRGELSIRVALGSGRGRIVRQMLVESLLLATCAGAAGLALAWQGTLFFARLVPAHVPLTAAIAIDGRVAVFTAAVSLATVVAFGLLPAVQASRPDLAAVLGSLRSGGAVGQSRLRGGLVVAEVALALVLTVGAGLLGRSFVALLSEELGFTPAGVVTAGIDLTATRYEEAPRRALFYEQLIDRLDAAPGVERAAMITRVPLGMSGGALIYTPEGQPTPGRDATFRAVTPGYFGIMGIALDGRDFRASDGVDGEPVAIIGRELARRAWPGEDPIGKRLKIGDESSPRPFRTVVGVVADVRQWSMELAPRPAIYVPHGQWTSGFAPRDLVVRGGEPSALAAMIRRAVRELDPDVPVSDVQPMSAVVGAAVGARRFTLQIFAAFAFSALLLAAVGIYGLLSDAVGHRVPEIGIRLALGARASDVLGMVMRSGMGLVAIGLAIGIGGAVAAARALESLLYGVLRLDFLTFATIPALLALVSLAAILGPALRASRVDPVEAMRR